MQLAQVTQCFPTIPDDAWEDSYLIDGQQRLLGSDGDLRVEVILEGEIGEVGVFYTKVTFDILQLLTLFLGRRSDAQAFVEESSAFVGRNPNTPYQKTFGDYSVRTSHIQGQDFATNTLIIQPAANHP